MEVEPEKEVAAAAIEDEGTVGPIEPAIEPEPAPFAGRERVTVDELLEALTAEVSAIAASEQVRGDFEVFVESFDLGARGLDLDALYLDFVRVKIGFEATRAGGLWRVAWDITNEQPESTLIWAHWQSLDAAPVPATTAELEALPRITTIAECDELSALFAYVTHRIGLSKSSEVGLFWPTGNHTVAVWTIDAKGDDPVRVVVPTSQVFLDGLQSLGTAHFDPRKQKNIFNYRHEDVSGSFEIPATLAARFIVEIREHGGLSQAALQERRNDLEHDQRWDLAD